MGDIKKQRKKYTKPSHPWNRARIESERILVDEYGLKNKKEIMRVESALRKFKHQAKELITRTDAQAEIEFAQLRSRLARLGLARGDIKIENVLDLSMKDLMERRLQTQVVRRHLARSMKQARQFITHGHIMVGVHKITVPGHYVTIDEEVAIVFASNSELSNPEHPERYQEEKNVEEEVKEIKEKPRRGKKKDIPDVAPVPEKAPSLPEEVS